MSPEFDQTSPESIEKYGQRLLNKTLRTEPGVLPIPVELLESQIGARTRGSFGTLLERYYYGINPGNESAPDFPEAGVELKSTPLKKLKNGDWSAKERLVLNIINYTKEAENTIFESSSFLRKNAQIMLVSYEHGKDRAAIDNPVRIAKLLKFSELSINDQFIIRKDWEHIVSTIRAGKAHELSEGQTNYLAACTKAASSLNMTSQPFGPEAKPRAYSFKGGYMTVLMRQILEESKAAEEYEEALKAPLENKTFEDEIVSRFDPYIGKSFEELSRVFEFESNGKDKYSMLARRIVGVKGRKIEEFEKAEITLKSIQLRADGMPKEAMSFPAFKFKHLAIEEWEPVDEDQSSSIFRTRLEHRFFFVIWKCPNICAKDEPRILEKVFFWSIPYTDLLQIQPVWQQARDAAKDSNPEAFPKQSSNPFIHVRPHGKNKEDVDLLPDGTTFPKQCFWLNKDYVGSITSGNGA